MLASTKSQIQIGETIAVILVFTLLITFGLLWFSYSQEGKQAIKQSEELRLELLEMTKTVMNLPELSCSVAGVKEHSCIDLYRAKSYYEETISGEYKDYYKDFFSGQRKAYYDVTINLIYPNPSDYGVISTIDVIRTIPEGTENLMVSRVPVVVLDPVRDISFFGVLLITQGDVI